MDLDTLINTGWGEHDQDTDGVAARLEEHAGLADTAAGAGRLLALSNHTIGQHLEDWSRAAALAERVAGSMTDDPEAGNALGQLAVARYLNGDAPGALAAESHAARLAEDASGALGVVLRVRALVVGALAGLKRIAEAQALYGPLLDLVRAQGFADDAPIVRSLAIVSNNVASDLLEVERTAEQDALMDQAAEAAREMWVRAGTWVNAERGDYLLALVHSARGRFEEGKACAERGLKAIADNGDEPVDEAFLHLALARAHKGLGADEDYATSVARAKELGGGFEGGLQDWFQGELAKATS